jgi:hypothetical protein
VQHTVLLKHVILQPSEVISDIRLMQHDIPRCFQRLTVIRTMSSNTEPQCNILHIVYHYSCVLWCILGHPCQTNFCNVISIQERHLRRLFDPNFVLRRKKGRMEGIRICIDSFKDIDGYDDLIVVPWHIVKDILGQ